MQGVFELPLPAILSQFLPRAQTGWSSLIAELQTGTYSLPALLVAAKKSLIRASQYKKKQATFDSSLPAPDTCQSTRRLYVWRYLLACSASFRSRAKIENDSWTLLCAFSNWEEALWDPGCAS